MAQKKQTRKRQSRQPKESDGIFFLKIVVYFIISTFWLRLAGVNIGMFQDISLPLGLVVGLLVARHEQFQIDRKIEYAVLLAGTILSFYLPVGFRF